MGVSGRFTWLPLSAWRRSVLGSFPCISGGHGRAWIHLHANFMCWSYVGLLAAFVSEVAVRIPGVGFGFAVIAATAIVVAGGAVLIHTRVPRILAAFTTAV